MNRFSTHNRSMAVLVASLLAGLSLTAAMPVLAQDEDAATPPAEEIETEVEAETETEELSKGEKRLAKMLEGRVAGEPQNCIRTRPTERVTTIDKTAYVYGSGNTIYVQRTAHPERIDDRQALVTRRFGSGTQICRQDITRTIDPASRIQTGNVFFEEFIPYTRVKDDEAEDS
ncbi:MAG: hypothetical protein AAFR64_11130 [Pseudomonadota bacterium]